MTPLPKDHREEKIYCIGCLFPDFKFGSRDTMLNNLMYTIVKRLNDGYTVELSPLKPGIVGKNYQAIIIEESYTL